MSSRMDGHERPVGDHEIEIKFSLPKDAFDQVKRLPLFEDAARGARLQSTYFDTPDLRLREEGITLRVRRIGDKRVQTVKRSDGRAADPHRRLESEHEIGGDAPDPRTLQSAIGGALARRLGSDPALRPVFTTDIERTVWNIVADGAAVECALDIGHIAAPNGSREVCELELELKEGRQGALFGIARQLQDELPLRIQPASKSTRGYMLARGLLPEPTKIDPPALERDMPVWQAFVAIALSCLAQILANQAVIDAGHSPDGLHKLRVGIRRLRAALTTFKPLLSPDRREAIGQELRWLQGAVSEARDWDVFIGELARMGEGERALSAMRAAAEAAREGAYDGVRQALGSKRYTRLVLDLGSWLHEGESGARAAGLKPFLRTALSKRRDRVLALGGAIDTFGEEQLHELRKAIKKYRYALEFGQPLFRDKPRLRKRLSALSDLQEVLGRVNDAAIGRRLISATLSKAPAEAERTALLRGGGLVEGWIAAHAWHSRSRMKAAWGDFTDIEGLENR